MPKAKTEVITLKRGKDKGEKIKFKEGGLHRSMGVPESYKFSKSQVDNWDKKSVGGSVSLGGRKVVITERIKKQISLAKTLMGFKK